MSYYLGYRVGVVPNFENNPRVRGESCDENEQAAPGPAVQLGVYDPGESAAQLDGDALHGSILLRTEHNPLTPTSTPPVILYIVLYWEY